MDNHRVRMDHHLVIGEVLKPQGVKGELKIRPITCDPMRFDGLNVIYWSIEDAFVPTRVRVTRIDRDAVYLMAEGVRDRDAADALRGRLLYVDRANAVSLPEDTEFIVDLIGCEATDDGGRTIGKLVEVLQPGATDVYVFRGPLGQVLVPALKSVVLHVDVTQKTMELSAARLAEVAVFEEE